MTVSDTAYLFRPANDSAALYSVNALNQYTAVTGFGAITYDNIGSLTSDGFNTYTYDTENRLTSVTTMTSDQVLFAYDPAGRRHTKLVNGTAVTQYLSDGAEEIAEYGDGVLLRRYVYGPGVDEPVAMVEASTGARQYYHTDAQGPVVAMTDDAGTIVEQYSYDPYGQSPATQASTGNPYRYTGRRLDPETGLYYYRARYYHPALGRFLQTDPIGYGDGMNLYAYVGNDPVNFVDPTGLAKSAVGGGSSGNSLWNYITGGTFEQADGSVQVRSSVILRALVPGQVAWNNARTAWANGNKTDAAVQTALMVAEIGVTVWTGGIATKASTSATAISTGTAERIPNWTLGEGKSAAKWAGQMERRGWTPSQIDEALNSGKRFSAPNNLNPANGATRYVHPETGRSVVTDSKTGQVIHVGGDGFKY